jgi:PAS domain S-box-containing protein
MKMTKPTSLDARARRQQAEQKLREQRVLAEQPASEFDARALVHELEVHRIELEMQNEELRRAEAQAQDAVEKYTDLFDFAPLGYFQLTQDGMIREANLAGAALLGLDRSQLVSRRFVVWVAPVCLRTFADFSQAVLASGAKQTCEIQLLCQGRGALDVQLEGLAAPGQAGPEKTWRLAVLDLTRRKLAEAGLERSERLYRAIGESIDYGVWVCEPDGRNIYASPSFLKLVGLTQEQCSNFGWGDVLHPEDAARTIAAWKECVRTGGTWDIEHRFRGVDGQWHPILARGVPVRDEQGTVTCWAGINLDISRLKQTEAEVQRHVAEFRAANEELTRFNEAMVGRELRMIELKQEVNALCVQLGQPLRYSTQLDEQGPPAKS